MTQDNRLEEYLEFCHRLYEEMQRDGTWPWAQADRAEADSTLGEDLVESESVDSDRSI